MNEVNNADGEQTADTLEIIRKKERPSDVDVCVLCVSFIIFVAEQTQVFGICINFASSGIFDVRVVCVCLCARKRFSVGGYTRNTIRMQINFTEN